MRRLRVRLYRDQAQQAQAERPASRSPSQLGNHVTGCHDRTVAARPLGRHVWRAPSLSSFKFHVLSLSLSLALALSHTHTHLLSYPRRRVSTHSHAHTRSHTHSHAHAPALALAPSQDHDPLLAAAAGIQWAARRLPGMQRGCCLGWRFDQAGQIRAHAEGSGPIQAGAAAVRRPGPAGAGGSRRRCAGLRRRMRFWTAVPVGLAMVVKI